MVGFRHRPAADVGCLALDERVDERGVAGEVDEEHVEASDTQADRQTAVAPAELLENPGVEQRLFERASRRLGSAGAELDDAELAVTLERRPERRARRDHISRVGELVELSPDRTQLLGSEAVHRLEHGERFVTEPELGGRCAQHVGHVTTPFPISTDCAGA